LDKTCDRKTTSACTPPTHAGKSSANPSSSCRACVYDAASFTFPAASLPFPSAECSFRALVGGRWWKNMCACWDCAPAGSTAKCALIFSVFTVPYAHTQRGGMHVCNLLSVMCIVHTSDMLPSVRWLFGHGWYHLPCACEPRKSLPNDCHPHTSMYVYTTPHMLCRPFCLTAYTHTTHTCSLKCARTHTRVRIPWSPWVCLDASLPVRVRAPLPPHPPGSRTAAAIIAWSSIILPDDEE